MRDRSVVAASTVHVTVSQTDVFININLLQIAYDIVRRRRLGGQTRSGTQNMGSYQFITGLATGSSYHHVIRFKTSFSLKLTDKRWTLGQRLVWRRSACWVG